MQFNDNPKIHVVGVAPDVREQLAAYGVTGVVVRICGADRDCCTLEFPPVLQVSAARLIAEHTGNREFMGVG